MKPIPTHVAALLVGVFTAASAQSAPLPISHPGDASEANLLPLLVDINNAMQSGRALFVGRAAGKLILATAGHVVARNPNVLVTFYRKAASVPGIVVFGPTDPNEDDLALIEIADDPQVSFDSVCVAPEGSNQDKMKVWYYGRNWSVGSAGVFAKTAQAGPMLDAYGLEGVDDGDSGGAILGQLGLVGILSYYNLAANVSQKQQIGFTSIIHAMAVVRSKIGETAWQIRTCAPKPIFRIDPSTCERPGAADCWANAALDAFRSSPVDFAARGKLARGVGQLLGEVELTELLATASPAERIDVLLNAALVGMGERTMAEHRTGHHKSRTRA
jgi:hypothetical protein